MPVKYWVVLLWTLLIAVSLYLRPLFPVDETRYAAVAWEMWLRNDFLVPHLNGETYSHKPPLLFWLMQLSWLIFGVNDWSLRVISPLFSLGALLLSARVAQALWPERKQLDELTPLLLLGSCAWIVYSTLTMFDMMLAFFVLLGVYSLIRQTKPGASWKGWLLFGLAIAGGVLTKGPVILLHLLPVALLAPWWHSPKTCSGNWSGWYAGIGLAVLVGAALALCWAIPAGIAGGEAYRNAIFLGQTSGRLVKSFAHRLPWWWYLQLVPVPLLPWLICKPFWQGIKSLSLTDSGLRFCMAWALPVFVAFSLVSGKRLHYLLPLLPALVLVLARLIDGQSALQWQRAHLPFSLLTAVLGIGLALLPWLNSIYLWKPELNQLSPWWGTGLTALAVSFASLKAAKAANSIGYMTALSIALLLSGSGMFFSVQAARYDTGIAGAKLAELMAAGHEIAFFGDKYHGQYHFPGRLTQPFAVLPDTRALQDWAIRHPSGYVILGYKESGAAAERAADYHYPYRGRNIALLAVRKFLHQPEVKVLFGPQ